MRVYQIINSKVLKIKKVKSEVVNRDQGTGNRIVATAAALPSRKAERVPN